MTKTSFTVDLNHGFKASPFDYEKKELIKRNHLLPIVCWRIYLDDEYISYISYGLFHM
jgi:hypothetical protein